MEEYYKISKQSLVNLLHGQMVLDALERDGVDNWEWYGESFKAVKKEYAKGYVKDKFADVKNDPYSFEQIAIARLKDYEIVEE